MIRDAALMQRSYGAEADLLAREALPNAERRVAPLTAQQADPAVYFVEAAGLGLIKIGLVLKVAGLQRRIGQLQAGCPFRLRLVFMLDGAGRKEEARLHKILNPYRHDREWFRQEGLMAEIVRAAAADPDEAVAIILRAMGCRKGAPLDIGVASRTTSREQPRPVRRAGLSRAWRRAMPQAPGKQRLPHQGIET